MGILEEIRDQNAKIIALLEGGAASSGEKQETAAEKKKREAAEKKAAAEAAKPTFTAEELRDQFIAVQKKHGDAVAKQLIKDCGFDKLANLIGDTSVWQKAMEAATAKLEEEPEGDDNGGL